MKFTFNRKVAAALAGVVVAVLVIFGVKDSDKIQKVLDAVVQMVPEEAPAPIPVPAGDAGAAGAPAEAAPSAPKPSATEASDAGVAK